MINKQQDNKMYNTLYSPRKTKFIIKHQSQCQDNQTKPINIFLKEAVSQFPLERTTIYSIVGDKEFKQKILKQTNKNESTIIETNNTMDSMDTKLQTICKYTSSIETGMLAHKLSKRKQIDITKQGRILNNFRTHKAKDKKIQYYLNKTLNKQKRPSMYNTLTFQSVKPIYAHPNPEKHDLVNNNIPEYWINSLRDNQKRLKRHLKGNTFKPSVAEQMLQTLRGKFLIEKSIPKIKEEFIPPICSRNYISQQRKKGFNLKGHHLRNKSFTSEIQDQRDKIYSMSSKKPFISDFDEIYKIDYDSKNRWRASEMSP